MHCAPPDEPLSTISCTARLMVPRKTSPHCQTISTMTTNADTKSPKSNPEVSVALPMIYDSRAFPNRSHEIMRGPTGSGLILPRSIKAGSPAHVQGYKDHDGFLNQIKYVQGSRAPICRLSTLVDARNFSLAHILDKDDGQIAHSGKWESTEDGGGVARQQSKQRRTKARAGNDLTKLTSRQWEEQSRLADLSAKK